MATSQTTAKAEVAPAAIVSTRTPEELAQLAALSIGAQVILDFNGAGSIGARGGAGERPSRKTPSPAMPSSRRARLRSERTLQGRRPCPTRKGRPGPGSGARHGHPHVQPRRRHHYKNGDGGNDAAGWRRGCDGPGQHHAACC